MLRWIPSGSMWQPENTDEVEIFGFEGGFSYLKNFGKHSVNVKANYGYTSSKNKKTENYLIYIPKHKANAGISYRYENLNVYGEFLYVGEVFTKSDNNSRYNIDAYQVMNFGTDYTFKKNYTIGIKVQNIFNTFYESVENRPLAGRNVMGYLILSQPLQRRGG